MRATDVFKAQGQPTVTLVADSQHPSMVQAFDDAVEEGGKVVRIIGPSKSGKTVFIHAKAGPNNVVWVSTSGVAEPDVLWNRVLASAGVSYQVGTSTTLSVEGQGEASAGGGGSLFGLAKAEAELKASAAVGAARDSTRAVATDVLTEVIRNLAGQPTWVFIDDFHYASSELQVALGQQIKHAAESGVKIAMALVPYRSEDMLSKNSDLQGRIVDIRFEYWNVEQLAEIAELGFPQMGLRVEPGFAAQLAREAAGSPQLMQAICLNLCREMGARESMVPPVAVPEDDELVARVCRRVTASVDRSATIEQMEKGPPTRGQVRNQYPVELGVSKDVYQLLVSALAINPPQLHFTYAQLQARVQQAALGQVVASWWESARHMADLANGIHGEVMIDYDGEKRMLSIRDPYLLFALRWGSGA